MRWSENFKCAPGNSFLGIWQVAQRWADTLHFLRPPSHPHGTPGILDRNLPHRRPNVNYNPTSGFSCSIGYTTTATTNENASTTFTAGYALESEYSGSAFGLTWNSDTKSSTTISQTQQFSQATNNSKGQTAYLYVKGYGSASYSGPNTFTLWQDNLYGTFMLYPSD